MKKIVSLALAFVLVVITLASCNNNNPNLPDASTPGFPSGSEQTPSSSPNASSTPESEPIVPDNVEFETRDEVVYVVNTEHGLKLRTSTSFANDSNVAEYADPGTELKRVGYHETWSKVVYNEKEYFCSSSFLSTEKPSADVNVEFTEVNETVYVFTGEEDGIITIYSIAYADWSVENKKHLITDMALPTEGMALTRTGIYYADANDPEIGWSRIEYNGITCYVRNSVLSTKAPEKPAASTNN